MMLYTFVMMRTRLTLAPGKKGAKKLLAQYGDQLVCVRYRYDAQKRRRYKTVELILAEREWEPTDPDPADEVKVNLTIDARENRTEKFQCCHIFSRTYRIVFSAADS